MSLSCINFLHLMVSKIWLGQDFIGQGFYSKVKGQIKVTPYCCTPTPRNQYPYKVSTSYTLQLQPGQFLSCCEATSSAAHMVANNTPTAIKGCGIKSIDQGHFLTMAQSSLKKSRIQHYLGIFSSDSRLCVLSNTTYFQ